MIVWNRGTEEDYDPDLQELLEMFFGDPDKQSVRPHRVQRRLLDDVEGELGNSMQGFDLLMFAALVNSHLLSTCTGMIGLGLEALQIGDIVCVLL